MRPNRKCPMQSLPRAFSRTPDVSASTFPWCPWCLGGSLFLACCATLVAISLCTIATPALADAAARTVRIVYVERDEDPFYDPPPETGGVIRTANQRPFAGAQLGLKDVAALGRAANVQFTLERRTVAADGDVAAEVKADLAAGAAAVLLDLPHDDIAAAAKAAPADSAALFNIRDTADDLRRDLCSTAVFHVIPSQAQLSDALAQFVVKKNWKHVLILVGQQPDDQVLAKSFAASARKFGASIIDTRPFIASNDPRQREQNSTALLTGDSDYDTVYLADSDGDFGRFVEYRQIKPRPAIGSEGLVASAWHQASERYGEDNVNHRFARDAGHAMSDLDWSAWVAVKAVAEAVTRGHALTPAAIRTALASDQAAIEMSKGIAGSFRAWDHQLRQPIMLHTADAVIDFAPLEGFLDQHSNLDTLGLSSHDVPCKGQ